MKQFLFAIGLLVCCAGASAHHSRAIYELQKWVTIEGTVKEWKWTNPHSALTVSVQEAAGGETEWILEGGSPSFLARDGWKRTDIKVGDRVVVKLNPRRDSTNRGSFSTITLSDGKVLGRTNDNNSVERKRAEDEELQ